eukprot:COSAG01_NODE_45574_length_408_cov_0.812298_1_plen_71_part_01
MAGSIWADDTCRPRVLTKGDRLCYRHRVPGDGGNCATRAEEEASSPAPATDNKAGAMAVTAVAVAMAVTAG